MTESIVIETATSTELEPFQIAPAAILSGAPKARNRILARSRDRNSCIMVWECTAGRFNWQYDVDETLVIVSGEVFVTNEKGEERRLSQGDVAFFPAGSSSTWRVTDHVKKVAFLRHHLPPLLGIGVIAWHRLLWVLGKRGRSSSTFGAV